MEAFHSTSFAHRIIFAEGALERIGEASEQFGWQRILLCTSSSQQAAGHVATIARVLSSRLVATYDHVQPHVQDTQVSEVLALARLHGIQAVIGLDGGSPIGIAKAVSQALEEESTRKAAQAVSPLEQPLIPVIAIPTTYAGSEMTSVYGITRTIEGTTKKVTVSHPKVAPRLILYDPVLTYQLPKTLTASSGVNALAHCFESLYSVRRNPLSTAAALGALRLMWKALPSCLTDEVNVSARADMLAGASLAGVALSGVTMGLPQRLRDAGVSQDALPDLAKIVFANHTIRNNPKPITDVAQLMTLLQQAW